MDHLGDISYICRQLLQHYSLKKKKKTLLPGVKLHLSTPFYVGVKEDAMDFEGITTETLSCIQNLRFFKTKSSMGAIL